MAHTEIQTRKVISSYGGVGSITETPPDFDTSKFTV